MSEGGTILPDRSGGSDWRRTAIRRVLMRFGPRPSAEVKGAVAAALNVSLKAVEDWLIDFEKGGQHGR